MNLIEVTDKSTARNFLKVPKVLYRHDTNFICQLDIEIEGIFDPQNNSCFKTGEAIRWILEDDKGKLIGRIAAFIDRKKISHYEYPTGGAGFFECIDNQDAANILFDAAKNWLKERGMEAMVAPVNFGENYIHWGLLIEGFMKQAYGMPYNFPYYRTLFENYGYRVYFQQFSYHKILAEYFPERMVKWAEHLASRPGISFKHFSFKEKEQFIDDFVTLYNGVWSAFHKEYTPLDRSEIEKLIEDSKAVIEEEFIWFAYDQGKPAGFTVCYPDVNQILAKLKNGKLNLINKLKFLFYRKRAVTRSRVMITGLLPQYYKTGLIAALFLQLVKTLVKRKRHTEIDLSWIGDYNPNMLSIYDHIGSKLVKKHATFMYLFDPEKPFKPFTIVQNEKSLE